MNKIIVISVIVCLILSSVSFFAGMSFGIKQAVSFGVNLAFKIIGDSNATQGFKDQIKSDLWRYRNSLGQCSIQEIK